MFPTGSDDVCYLCVVLWQGNRQRLTLQGAVIVAVGMAFGLIGQQGTGAKLFSQLLENSVDQSRYSKSFTTRCTPLTCLAASTAASASR